MNYCGPRGIALSTFLSWPRSDQDAALHWAAREARRCSSCGTDPVEWAEDRHAYHPHITDQCPGCLQKHRREEATKKRKDGSGGLEPGEHVVMAIGAFGACPRCNPRGATAP